MVGSTLLNLARERDWAACLRLLNGNSGDIDVDEVEEGVRMQTTHASRLHVKRSSAPHTRTQHARAAPTAPATLPYIAPKPRHTPAADRTQIHHVRRCPHLTLLLVVAAVQGHGAGRTALHYAATHGQIELINKLEGRFANVNQRDAEVCGTLPPASSI